MCCSGGGIRAAAFSLGGLQGLGSRTGAKSPWLDGVDLITAVSGGSYIASSFAMVNHHLSPEQRAELPPYAPGSPEDNRLRTHTRYLIEDPRAAALGVLSIVYGLVLNLLPILAGVFLAARGTGWLLRWAGILMPGGATWELRRVGVAVAAAAVPAVAAAACYSYDRLCEIYRPPNRRRTEQAAAWTLRLLVVAGAIFALFVAVPWLLRELSTTRVDITPGSVDWRSQLAGFLATATAIVGLVKTTLGRFQSKLQVTGSAASGKITTLISRAVRALAPWLGSAVVLGLLLVALLTWVGSSAYTGITGGQLAACGVAALLILGWQCVTDVNRNSVHAYYRSRLSSAFAVWRTPDGDAHELPYDEPVRLPDLQGERPELVVCAAVNTTQRGVVPSGRGCAPWTFSPYWTGISSGTMFDGEPGTDAGGRMAPAEVYAQRAGEAMVTLPAAVAVSGAAVSPVMGRMTRAPLRLLLGVANVRLGLWLPNPMRAGDLPPAPTFGSPPRGADGAAPRDSLWTFLRWQGKQPGIRALLAEMLGQTGLAGRWVYVTDGGHYENLGLVEALRRGATEIVAFDASGDQPNSWSTFGEAIETARADLGVEIDLDPSLMKPPKDSTRAPSLVVPGYCTYANGVQARLWLCKLALPEKASWDVFAWANSHPEFPHDSTAQQLYGDREFEAYRRLGEVAAAAAVGLYDRDQPSVDGPDVSLPEARPAVRPGSSAVGRQHPVGVLMGEEGIAR
ncbi:MAG: hypothetical protein ABJC62_13405 [Frankiaceae bacterium]